MRTVTASALLALALILVVLQSGGRRVDAAPPTGLDVSWPQCGKPLPAAPAAFAVVGVDNGKAYTTNPCFKRQYEWAGSTGTLPAIYMTLRSPQGPTAVRGLTGPAGSCMPNDDRCVSRNYGYNAAEAALAHAQQQVAPPDGTMWWLDIETMSHWSTDQAANAAVIQGAIDFLQHRGILFGVYSTRSQWNTITGGYTLPPGLPIWIAGAKDSNDAPTLCIPRHTFGGGQLWMVQYIANDLDHNHVCGEPMSVTILTRSISSASAASMAALRVAPAPEPPPPPAREGEAPPPSLPPKPLALELAHLEGRGLRQLPSVRVSNPAARDCNPPAATASASGRPTLRRAIDADRPRLVLGARRRRLVA